MEGSISSVSANIPTSFLECQRCGGFILSETSTAKRIHNVRCLSSLVVSNKDMGSSCDIFQGYVKKSFRVASIKLPKLSTEEIASARLALRSQEKIVKNRRGRPPGTGNRNGLKISNIIGERRISGRVCQKSEKDASKAIIPNDTDIVKAKTNDNELSVPSRISNSIKKRRGRPPGTKKQNGAAKILGGATRISSVANMKKARYRHLKNLKRATERKLASGKSKDDEVTTKSQGPADEDSDGLIGNVKKRQGRLLGFGSRQSVGIDVTNIIEETKRSRAASMKAKEKFKDISGEDTTESEFSDNTYDSDSDLEMDVLTAAGRIPKKEIGRRRKFPGRGVIELTSRERYLLYKKGLTLEEIRAAESSQTAKDVSGKDATKSEGNKSSEVEMDTLTAAGRLPKKRVGRHRKYPGRGVLELTSRERYLLYTKHLTWEEIQSTDYSQTDSEMDALTAEGRIPKKRSGRRRKYPGRGIAELTGREKYLLYVKRLSLENIRGGEGNVYKAEYDRSKEKRRILTSEEFYNRYVRKVICSICKEYVKAFYLEMHVSHFHTKDHDQQNCDCILRHCKPVDKNKVEESKRKQKANSDYRSVKENCPKCDKMISRSAMKGHLALHERPNRIRKHCVKNLKCALCQNDFASHHGLKAHFVSVHMQNSPYACKFAGCKFRGGDYFHLERHVMVHLKENRIKCKWCGKLLSKTDSLYRHVVICPLAGKKSAATTKLKNSRRSKLFERSYKVKRIQAKDFSIDKAPVESDVKRESVFEMQSIHLYDKIIETENGPVHVKGEQLDAHPETSKVKFESDSQSDIGTLTAIAVSADVPSTNNKPVIDEDADSDDSKSDTEWDEAKIRETVNKKIMSWDDKLQDVGYVNDIIKQDPVFQKLEEENEEFAKLVLRHGSGRRNYFIVNKTAQEFKHRCDVCFRAFRRSWALLNHKKQKICHLMTQKGNSADHEHEKTGNASNIKTDCTTSVATKPQDSTEGVSKSSDSINFMCSTCGFESKSAAELEQHMKTSPLHNKTWWKERTHKCPKKCGAWFSDVKRLNEHIDNVHMKQKDVKCSQCSKAFASQVLLRRHVYHMHDWSQRPTFLCSKCGKRFKVKENHEKHVKECTIELRRPKCHQCNEHFGTEHSLQRHVRNMHLNGNISNTVHHVPNPSSSNDMPIADKETVETNSTQPCNDDDEMDNNESLILGF